MKSIIAIYLLFATTFLVAEQDSIKIKSYEAEELIVIDNHFGIANDEIQSTINSTEDILKQKNEIDLISRANFASEAVVRGYTQDRLNVTIDGMRMFSACIDKMDPITSYIEVENLSKSEVNSDKSSLSNGISTGGSLNFITNKPKYNHDLRFVTDNQFNSVSDMYNSRGNILFGSGNIAALTSYSVKQSGNYKSGGNNIISKSGYSKENVKFNVSYKSDSNANHSLEYIYDHSADVGYPALIMDTRYTHMNMASYNLNLKNLGEDFYDFNTRIYFNNIEHLMDDYDRSDDEINNRIVMPGMYMPMYGETTTFGLNSNIKKIQSDGILSFSLEAYNMNAFADMKMEMLETDEIMYLVNLGDINTTKVGLNVGYITSFDNTTTFKLNGRFDISNKSMNNEFSKAITESYWGDKNSVMYNIFNISSSMSFELNDQSDLGFTISRIEREPSHLENYGFYIYNISDNSIYTGSPDLDKEISYSINADYSFQTDNFEISTKVYNDYLVDYIAGTNDNRINIFEGFGQTFKQFGNIGNANIAGIEVEIDYQISNSFFINSKAKYQKTHSFKFNESLPFTPPLSGKLSIVYSSESLKSVLSADMAGKQNDISYSILTEDVTDAYAVVNFRNSYSFSDDLRIRFGVENIFDELYHTHFSINNLPNPGRNFYLGLSLGI